MWKCRELAWKTAARRVVGLARKHEPPGKVGYVLAWIYPGEPAFHECTPSEVCDDALVADLSKSGRFWS